MIDYTKAVIMLVIISVVLFGAFSLLTSGDKPVVQTSFEHTENNYEQFVSAELEEDNCAVPSGYTEESWKEHMGHHPERYVGCDF